MTEDTERFVDLPSGVRIAHTVDGPDDGPALVLVAGLGQQLHSWPAELVERLVDQGFRVVRLDNRDAGRSSRVPSPPPPLWRQALVRPRADGYTLTDMAGDVVGLLDHLGARRAHLVGMSMGGMISQTVAAHWPERVLTLTSIFSTTGHARTGQPAWSTKRMLIKPPGTDRAASVARHVAFTTHLAGTGYPLDPAVETAYAETAWDRSGGDPRASAAGTARQIQAIQASGDRTRDLARIVAPTLVVHGDRDLIVHPSGGAATARAIAGARLVSIPGMGHHLAPGLTARLADLIAQHASGVAA